MELKIPMDNDFLSQYCREKMFTRTVKKWFALMAAALVIAFSGCSDGGGGDGGIQEFSSFPNNAVLAEFGLSGLTPPVGCTFVKGVRYVDNDSKALSLQWTGSDAIKTEAYRLKVSEVWGSVPIYTSNWPDLTWYDWKRGSYSVQLSIVKIDFTDEGRTISLEQWI